MSDEDIEECLAAFRQPGALCYIRVWTTNQGLSVEISFNSPTWSNDSGSLRLALREAIVEIAARSSDWTWNEAFLETVEDRTVSTEETSNSGGLTSRKNHDTFESKVSAKGKIRALFAEAALEADLRNVNQKQDRMESTQSRQQKFTRVRNHMTVQRHADKFVIEFDALGLDDLGGLNPALSRMSLIDTPEPASADLQMITVDLKTLIDDGDPIHHAFHIKHATGAWSSLKENNNKRIVSEILLSKFLIPLHDSVRLWPTDRTDDDDRRK